MILIDEEYGPILLESLEDLLYKLSMQLNELKGGPLSKERKTLTHKQNQVEELQHLISIALQKS